MLNTSCKARLTDGLACRRPGETWQTNWTPPPSMTWHAPPGDCKTCKLARLASYHGFGHLAYLNAKASLPDSCAEFRRLQGSDPAPH